MAFLKSTKASSSGESIKEKDVAKTPYENDSIPERMRRVSSVAPGHDQTLAILDLVQEQDAHHPIHWPSWKRWSITLLYCSLQVFVTLTSTTYVSAEYDIGLTFPASTQVITLGQSMFILGTAVGPAFMGPLADMGGRKWVYVVSILLYAILNIVSMNLCKSGGMRGLI